MRLRFWSDSLAEIAGTSGVNGGGTMTRTFGRACIPVLTLASGLAIAGTAGAADLWPMPTKAPPVVVSGPSWTGFYIGGAIGGGAVVHKLDAAFGGANATLDGIGGEGVLGSIYGGFDYQLAPRWVVGIMADGTWSNIETTATVAAPPFVGANASIRADTSWSVLGRVGWLSSPGTLWYVLGGYTWQNFHTDATATVGGIFAPGAFALTRDDAVNGWTFGGGVESQLVGAWFTRLEYRFTQFDRKAFLGGILGIEPSMHTIRLGLSYKFGGQRFGAAPMPAAAAPVANWTGLHLGGAFGAGAVVHRVDVAAGGASATLDGIGGEGILGSVYGGFDYQLSPRWVAGVMVDATWSNIETTFSAAGIPIIGGATASLRADEAWSVLARLGWLYDPTTLWYVLGGYTRQNFHTDVTAGGFALSRDDATNGWTIGGGIEAALTSHWFAKLEYRFTQLDRKTFLAGVLGIEPSMHTVRLGVSYKFNWNMVRASY